MGDDTLNTGRKPLCRKCLVVCPKEDQAGNEAGEVSGGESPKGRSQTSS